MHGQEEDVFYLFDYTEYAYPIGPALATKLIKMYTENKPRTCKQISVKGLAGTECMWKTKDAKSTLQLFNVKHKMYAQVVIRPEKSKAKDNATFFFDSLNIVVKE